MKVVMLGASGAGKTTLAKKIAEKTGLKYIENSAGLILTGKAKERLQREYGYEGNLGQRGVINKSHLSVSFAVDFQDWVLKSRTELLQSNEDVIIDRSPLDPTVFWLNQVVHNTAQDLTEGFLKLCFDSMFESGVTHLIRVPLLNPEYTIEDNNSRVANWWFQKKIDLLCDFVIQQFNDYKNRSIVSSVDPRPFQVRVHQVITWDLNQRVNQALQFLNKDTI